MDFQINWIWISVALALVSLGFGGLFKFLICVLVFLLGALVILLSVSSNEKHQTISECIKEGKQVWRRQKLASYRAEQVPLAALSLTGTLI